MIGNDYGNFSLGDVTPSINVDDVVKALRLEEPVQQAALARVVIDDQDARWRTVLFGNIRRHGQDSSRSPVFP